jgi:hypothetical protein
MTQWSNLDIRIFGIRSSELSYLHRHTLCYHTRTLANISPVQFGNEDILALIDTDAAKHISLLQALIRTPSPNPPGNTADAIDVVRKYLDLSGISTKLIAPKPESPNLVSVLHVLADPCGRTPAVASS